MGLINIRTMGEVGAPLNLFKSPVKYFYWPFQGGASFLDHLCYFCLIFCYAFMRVCLLMPCRHLLGKGWPFGSRLLCLTVKLSLSHWYPGSGVVLDCIDSWYLHSYLLSLDMGVCECGFLLSGASQYVIWYLPSFLLCLQFVEFGIILTILIIIIHLRKVSQPPHYHI